MFISTRTLCSDSILFIRSSYALISILFRRAAPSFSMNKGQLVQMLVGAPTTQAKQILGGRLYALIQVRASGRVGWQNY